MSNRSSCRSSSRLRTQRLSGFMLLPLLLLLLPALAQAAESAHELPGAALSLWYALPFAGVLLCIALMPLLLAQVWHAHFGKITLAWTLVLLLPLALQFGATTTLQVALATLLHEYLPFIILLLALYTVSGGVYLQGNLHGTPALNTALLAIGAGLASVMGTTGASILLIRPLLHANDTRRHRTHVVVFFIFLVSNIGGSLTPLGDPPLFLGFLKGVSFGWTFTHMVRPMLLCSVLLLALFYLLDRYFYAREDARTAPADPTPDSPIKLHGWGNVALLVVVLLAVLLSGIVSLGQVQWLGMSFSVAGLLRDGLLLLVAVFSYISTKPAVHLANHFMWAPMLEVAKLFFGIFLTMMPLTAMLRAGSSGAFAPLVALTTTSDGAPNNLAYFWMTGLLSSFLDNAPTYLVFFNLAGGDATLLTTTLTTTLLAISCGAVFMGANSYIGNAPNLMVKAIAEHRGVPMPSFLGYMVWSGGILLPLFALVTLVFFR